MFRKIVAYLALAAILIVSGNLGGVTTPNAGQVVLTGAGIALLLAALAEVIFRKRSDGFWCMMAFIGGVAGALLCLLNLMLYGKHGIDPILWIFATGTLASLLYPVLWQRLKVFRGVFIPIALVNMSVLLLICVLMAANLPLFAPPEPKFESRPTPTEQQRQDMKELLSLIARPTPGQPAGSISQTKLNAVETDIVRKLNNSLLPDELAGVDLAPVAEDLAKVQPELNQLWSFLAERNPVGESALDAPTPSYLAFRIAVKLEGLAILLEAQQGKDFHPRLHRYMKGCGTWLNLDIGLIQTMIGTATTMYSASMIIPLAEFLDTPDPELLRCIRANRELIYSSQRKMLITEYAQQHDLVTDFPSAMDSTERFMQLVSHDAFAEGSAAKLVGLLDERALRWPTMNYRDTLYIIETHLRKYFGALDALDYEKRAALIRAGEAEIEDALSHPSFLVNPIGRKHAALYRSNHSRAYFRIAVTEARLGATELLLLRKWGMTDQPPIQNPFTGKSFTIASDGSIRISEDLPASEIKELTPIYPDIDKPIKISDR